MDLGDLKNSPKRCHFCAYHGVDDTSYGACRYPPFVKEYSWSAYPLSDHVYHWIEKLGCGRFKKIVKEDTHE